MRFEQQISGFPRVLAVAGVAFCLFASGRPVSASEQNATPAAAQPPSPAPAAGQSVVIPQGPQLQLSADEAVRMALENNLGIRAERLSPQVQALIVSQTRANYAPTLISTFAQNSSTTPPQDFLSGSDN